MNLDPPGASLLKDPIGNKGTAFSRQERHDLGLEGLLPYAVESIEDQLARVRVEFDTKRTPLGRHIYLRQLQDGSRTLFYRFLLANLEELLPIVYTPTVGEACEQFSRIYRRPHGLFVAFPDIDHLDEMLDNLRVDDIRVIVVTDGERILGLGDQGVGGMGIPVGKLALYTACAGIHPGATLPVFLDVGTNNLELLEDPLYLGWRHERITGADYEEFVDRFVSAVGERFPGVLLQWEDFAQHHATELLERHRSSICSFNDDIQGTAAVARAAVTAGARQNGERLADQRIVIVGAGSAGSGIGAALLGALVGAGLTEDDALERVLMVDRNGLLHDAMEGLAAFQVPLAQRSARVADWSTQADGSISLLDVIEQAHPTVLIGVTGMPGAFTGEALSAMAAQVERPIVLPLSNPTARSEATPGEIEAATGGRALVATGSPFSGVAQANNVYVFPGIGLGVLASGATAVTDTMLSAASAAVAALAPPGQLLPPMSTIREVSRSVAEAVASAANDDGVATTSVADPPVRLDELIWFPDH
jgi:malate dehydrogenase (oxaloacetate-decarboxylating)